MAKLPVIDHTDHSLGTISLKSQTSSISGLSAARLKESYCIALEVSSELADLVK
jgi:hypothetical protein